MKRLFSFLCAALCLVLFSLFGKSSLSAQSAFFICPSFEYGRIIPNRDYMRDLWNVDVCSYSLRIGKQTTGQQDWEQRHHFPDYGIALSYTTIDTDLIGNSCSLIGYLNGSFYRNKKFSLHYLFGLGIDFFPVHHDPVLNNENIFIGSKINARINLELGFKYRIADNMNIMVSACFHHSSNGAVKLPNLGVNCLKGKIGIEYFINNNVEFLCTLDSMFCFTPRNELSVELAGGIRQAQWKNERYGKGALQLSYMRHCTPLIKYGGGIEFFYNGEYQTYVSAAKWKPSFFYTASLFSSLEVLYNRLTLHFLVGMYAYRPVKENNTFYYERVGIKYSFGKTRNHYAGIFIKAHAFKADFIEIAYGYSFYGWNDKKSKAVKTHYKKDL